VVTDGNPSNDDEAAETVGGEMSEVEIDYNLMGTFPASDPPSWTLGVGPHRHAHEEFEGEKPSVDDPSHQNDAVTPDQGAGDKTG
jgi:hypothetical protein